MIPISPKKTRSPLWISFLALLLTIFIPSLFAADGDSAQKTIITINKDHSLSFSGKGLPTEIIRPRTYKKLITMENILFSISYGLNTKTQPTLFIQLKSAPTPQAFFEFDQHLISLTPEAMITLTLSDSLLTTTLTPGHFGTVKLDQTLLAPGIIVAFVKSKNNAETPPSGPRPPVVPTEQKAESISTIPQEPTGQIPPPRSPITLKSLERRKIQIETLRETAKSIARTAPLPQPLTAPEPIVVNEIEIKKNPEEESALIRENQVLLQVTQGLQNILDQITNNPLSADETFQIGLPPLPPIPIKPPLLSAEDWTARLQSENNTYRQKAIQTRSQLLKYLETLPHPSFRLTPLIPENVEEEARLASKAYKQQNWDNAALHYQNALKKEPLSLHLLSNLGVVYFSQGNYDSAEKTLRQTVQQAPHDSFSYSILGICYLQKENIEEAINALLISVNLNPNDHQSQNYLSMALTKKGWLVTAEEHARESIRINPNYSEAHYNLVQIYINQKPISRELAKKHYNLSVNLGGARDESIETLLQIPPPSSIPNTPQIQINP